jgi:integrase
MARVAKRLSARTVATATEPGKYADGDGLYLVVSQDGASLRRRWLLYFTWNSKRREMGLGSVREVSLAEARQLAEEARRLVRDGVDPIAARNAEGATVMTFGAFADQLIAEIEVGFKNEKHRYQWRQTLSSYAAPIRDKPIDSITTDDVLACVRPLWATRQETASRLRGRIERVLDAAKARGLRHGENPARWRGHLANLLPRRVKLQRGHHPALPFADVPAFVAQLRTRKAVAALALEFTILAAARAGEVFGATWREVDLEARLWVVPASRMKAGRQHRVPLSERAVQILNTVAVLRLDDSADTYVFPGARQGRALSNMAFKALMLRMGFNDITAHGFRSSFRDWAGECTDFPREVAEAALAHVIGDETERAYRRGDALAKRRSLMTAWAKYCDGVST